MKKIDGHDPRARAADRPAAATPLAQRFQGVRAATRALAAPLSPEDCALQSMPDASPVKWHMAHTSWFFETFVLAPGIPAYRPFNPLFRMLFNSYYNGVGDKFPRPERGLLSRPGLDEIVAYREHVDAHMAEMLQRDPSPALAAIIELGLNHEQQHQELILTDLKHLLAKNPLQPVYRKNWPLTTVHPRRRGWVDYPEGVYESGHDGTGFAFDNEGPRHRTFVAGFALASHPVTHGDFLEFIADGGYRRPELWLSMGWDAVQAEGWQAPLYWRRNASDGGGHGGNVWQTFTLHGLADIDATTPACHVSYFEADAFARWAGERLPTEFEWEIAAHGVSPAGGNFLDSGAFHPLALRDAPAPETPAQLFGDVWEWTQSDYGAYPGYRPPDGAIGEYNGKFMCGQYVLRGGSCATPASHIRASYRNFFPPHARWQFSGLRLARDLGPR